MNTDKKCFISEFRDDIKVCTDCGTELADGPAPPLLELPTVSVGPEPLSKAQKNLMWTVASYSEEGEAVVDLERLSEEDIEAVISPDQAQDENGLPIDLYHLQVLPINRFVAQGALGIEEPEEDIVSDDYWDELDAAGHFSEYVEPEESAYTKLLEEPEEESSQFPLLATIVTILLVLVLLWTMTRAYQLF